MRSIVFGLLFATAFCSEALSQSTRFCIGEKRCPASSPSLYPCGSNAEQIAEEICTVRLGGGDKKVLPHRLEPEGTHNGHRCGYSWYKVTCINN